MPEYLAPGVYVEEVPSAVKPIAGVSTSTAGFIAVVPDSVQLPGPIKGSGSPPKFASVAVDRKSTRLNSSHGYISYAVFCLKKKKKSNRSTNRTNDYTYTTKCQNQKTDW